MPSNTRWTLNPRKWFGTISYTGQKHEKNNNSLPPVPSTATTTTRTITLTNPRLSTGKNKINVIPISISNDTNKTTTTMVASITQLQLPAFSIRRERISSLLPSQTSFNRQNTFIQNHTEPSIRKNGRFEEQLSIDTKRYNNNNNNIQSTSTTNNETIEHRNIQENFPIHQTEISLSNMSHQCLIDYPKYSANIMKELSTPTRSSSSSSLYNENDNSSSSGIYTDERQCTESKDTLSILEALSIESIADSQTSLNHCHNRPMIHHYRRPMSDFKKNDEQPQQQQQQQNSVIQAHRSQSAEGILKDNEIISPIKSRQSSAAINKKIDKHISINRSPTTKLEKVGFIRIANDTYRLNTNKFNYLSQSRKNSIDSFIPYSNYDDPLRSANNEECYATLPRTSSTEQLNNNNNIHNNLRNIVDECIRPMVTSIGKNRFTKNYQQRYKRPHIHNDHTQLNIEHITDKLLSSVDCSTYARYQRSY
ncbi:unnamed protein product [Rotaria sordida]|uniref:Uncharacterized protein n=1 Tax=Rotaria sordida TaxID=392033 RepID=A0A814D723_9BILA|nr:unnamed protein product [Rotaria sordida]